MASSHALALALLCAVSWCIDGAALRHEAVALECGGRSAMVGVNTTHLTRDMKQGDLLCLPVFHATRSGLGNNICSEPFTYVQRITYQARRVARICGG